MSDAFLLSARKLPRIPMFFPLSNGVPRDDDWRVIGGIVYVIKQSLTGILVPLAFWCILIYKIMAINKYRFE
ncbi:hypothetical protein [Acidocella sp. KAb 2-4]|uniref:hypothetical protein n=1 Tax=Acidocella sp. KAb 2-4 TaxID=2885158 RepID=UPI001D08DCDA|nr:hypothetical protein [Acidocella sp. KAb 2-4]MCB5944229.1 hypothetical protein [Acidocella sp. KAb 2-4]